jgi:hypothetical protein
MRSRTIVRTSLVLAVFAGESASGQSPIGADITYQGQLKQSGVPLDTTADFEFRLFDTPSAGVQLGSTNPINNVNVVEGLFTVPLNFGVPAFNGDARFLQIAVRSPAGSGNFTTLSPRQPMTAVPYALYALTGPGSGGPWAVNGNNVFNTNTGNVGIGTTTPSVPLHIAASVADPALVLQDTGPASTQTGYVSFWNSAPGETGWVGFGSPSNPHFSISNARTGGDVALFSGFGGSIRLATNNQAMIVSSTGNVGIGTTSPAAKLDVRGDIQLGNFGQFFAAAGEENLRIIRGNIDGDGSTDAGSGFTCVRTNGNDGMYTITFTPPFGGTPSVTATPNISFSDGGPDQPRWAHIVEITSTHVDLWMVDGSFDYRTNSDFSFCAIGPR